MHNAQRTSAANATNANADGAASSISASQKILGNVGTTEKIDEPLVALMAAWIEENVKGTPASRHFATSFSGLESLFGSSTGRLRIVCATRRISRFVSVNTLARPTPRNDNSKRLQKNAYARRRAGVAVTARTFLAPRM
eukprot:scaffold544_cov117-Isochrysis_galbana.AAC.26